MTLTSEARNEKWTCSHRTVTCDALRVVVGPQPVTGGWEGASANCDPIPQTAVFCQRASGHGHGLSAARIVVNLSALVERIDLHRAAPTSGFAARPRRVGAAAAASRFASCCAYWCKPLRHGECASCPGHGCLSTASTQTFKTRRRFVLFNCVACLCI